MKPSSSNAFKRAMASSMQQARAIVRSQASRAARLAAADDVLLNEGSVADLRQAVDRLHQDYLQLAQAQAKSP